MAPFTPAHTLNSIEMLAPTARATPAPADRRAASYYQQVLQHDPPGSWGADKYEQTNHLTGMVSVAAKAYTDAVAAAKATAWEKKRTNLTRKSLGIGHYATAEEYEPCDPDHPLCRVIEEPGGPDGAWEFTQELEFLTLQYLLTGDAPAWAPHNATGKPVRFFALTSARTQPMFGLGVNPMYPKGAYRVQPYQGMSGFYMGGQIAAGAILPAEEVGRLREMNPWDRSLGMSRLQAGAKEIDVLEAITESRWGMFDHGLQLDTVALLPGIDTDECKRLQADLTQKAGGARNARRFVVLGGGAMGDKFDLKTFGQSAREMDYQQSYDQAAGVVLAFFRVPRSTAGLTNASTYSGLYAEKQQLREYGLIPHFFKLSRFATQTVAKPWNEYPGQYKIEVECPPLGDVEAEAKEREFAWTNDLIKKNAYLKATGREPEPDGDGVKSELAARIQQKYAPPPVPQDGAGDPNAPDAGQGADPIAGLLGDDSGADDTPEGTQDAVTSAALGALGVGESVRKAWDESRVNRDHGRFAEKYGAWRAEDDAAEDAREAEDDAESDRHAAEDAATEKRHDRESAAHERETDKRHAAEEKAVEKARAAEDKARERARERGAAGREKAREKEDAALDAADEREREEKGVERLQEEMFARQQAEDDGLTAAHAVAYEGHKAGAYAAIGRGELDPVTANDQVGAARAGRERELAALRARHAEEEEAFEEAHRTQADRDRERIEREREAGDAARDERESQEDNALETARGAEDADRGERQTAERGEIDGRHDAERGSIEADRYDAQERAQQAREAEDRTRYHARRAGHPEAHAAYYGPDDHARHGAVQKAVQTRAEGSKWQGRNGKWYTKKQGRIEETADPSKSPRAAIAAHLGVPAPTPQHAANHDALAAKLLAGRPHLHQITPSGAAHKITGGASLKAFLDAGGKLPTEAAMEAAKAVPVTSPVAQQTLATVNQWAKGQADKHADKVAQHFGISREKAHALLLHAITQVAAHAASNGGKAVGFTLRDKRSGKTVSGKPVPKGGPTSGQPPRPANPAAKGSGAPKVTKAVDDRRAASLGVVAGMLAALEQRA